MDLEQAATRATYLTVSKRTTVPHRALLGLVERRAEHALAQRRHAHRLHVALHLRAALSVRLLARQHGSRVQLQLGDGVGGGVGARILHEHAFAGGERLVRHEAERLVGREHLVRVEGAARALQEQLNRSGRLRKKYFFFHFIQNKLLNN